MRNKELSIFIDESGDLGRYVENSPFYIVSFVFHEQTKDITDELNILNNFLLQNNIQNQAIHSAPLIRRENIYKNADISFRNTIFKQIFNFAKNIDIHKHRFVNK